MKFAIMTFDPGGTTGCATGLFNTEGADDMAALLRRAVRKRALSSWEVKGEWHVQPWKIMEAWDIFYDKAARLGVDPAYIHFVAEDFQLRQRSADLAPVAILCGVRTLLEDEADRLEIQQPSEAKKFATNDRMRRWGVWQVGSEHRRDAVRHLCVKTSKIFK